MNITIDRGGRHQPALEVELMTLPKITLTCPQCRSTNTEEYGHPIPNTDDYADCVQCRSCRHTWGIDPAAAGSCTTCGGSGDIGRKHRSPKCHCVENY